MIKNLKIQIPKGYEIDVDNSTFHNIVFKKKPEHPRTWEEFCEQNSVNNPEYYIMGYTSVFPRNRDFFVDKTLLSTKEDAEAHLALIQLHRLRDVYRQGWVKYSDGHCYNIVSGYNGLYISDCGKQRFLSFQSQEVAEEFLKNFRELIIKAGDLIQ